MCPVFDVFDQFRFQPVIVIKTFHISRYPESHFPYRKSAQKLYHGLIYIPLRCSGTVHPYHRHTKFFFQLRRFPPGFYTLRFRRIHDDDKRLPQIKKLLYDSFLSFAVIFTIQSIYSPIRSYHYAHGGMLFDDFFCSYFGRLRKGQLIVATRGRNHPRCIILHMSHGSRDHISYTIHKADLKTHAACALHLV